jgi:hypothetical protein
MIIRMKDNPTAPPVDGQEYLFGDGRVYEYALAGDCFISDMGRETRSGFYPFFRRLKFILRVNTPFVGMSGIQK